MRASLESDFDRFAERVRSDVAARTESVAAEASAVRRSAEAGAERERTEWLERARSEWTEELHALESREYAALNDAMRREWAAFRTEREEALRSGLEQAVEKAFAAFAACFVDWVRSRYDAGSFFLPKGCASRVDDPRFDLREGEANRVVFRRENLYISLSPEGIVEELGDAVDAALASGEAPWRA